MKAALLILWLLTPPLWATDMSRRAFGQLALGVFWGPRLSWQVALDTAANGFLPRQLQTLDEIARFFVEFHTFEQNRNWEMGAACVGISLIESGESFVFSPVSSPVQQILITRFQRDRFFHKGTQINSDNFASLLNGYLVPHSPVRIPISHDIAWALPAFEMVSRRDYPNLRDSYFCSDARWLELLSEAGFPGDQSEVARRELDARFKSYRDTGRLQRLQFNRRKVEEIRERHRRLVDFILAEGRRLSPELFKNRAARLDMRRPSEDLVDLFYEVQEKMGHQIGRVLLRLPVEPPETARAPLEEKAEKAIVPLPRIPWGFDWFMANLPDQWLVAEADGRKFYVQSHSVEEYSDALKALWKSGKYSTIRLRAGDRQALYNPIAIIPLCAEELESVN